MYNFDKIDLFSYYGDFDDFEERSERYFAQLAVQYRGLELRNNNIAYIIDIGRRIYGDAVLIAKEHMDTIKT
jgi:hypothetical protein